MDDETLEVNAKNRSTIIRVVHNRENPFVQLNKKALWDENLSLKAIGLWSRCMSRPDNWNFNIKELIDKCKEGRKAIDAAMKELIEYNYALRMHHTEKDENGKYSNSVIEYVFFEFPATDEEKEAQLEFFKKSFPHSGFGDSRFGDSRKSHLLIYNSKEIHVKDIETPPIPPQKKEKEKQKEMPAKAGEIGDKKSSLERSKKAIDSFSPEVQEVGQKIIEILKTHEPEFIPPKNLAAFLTDVDFLLRIDQRDPQRIFDILSWALSDSFWRDKMFKPNPAKYLREKFLQLKNRMEAKPVEVKKERRFSPSSNDEKAYEIMKKMQSRSI